MIRFDPDSVIGDGVFGHVFLNTGSKLDNRRSIGMPIFDSVIQQINEDLSQ